MEKYDYSYNGSEGYCYPGTDVLKNKLGIKNDKELTIAEREITSLKLLIFYNAPIIEQFSFDTLCKIHKVIFEDIYEWAGQIRTGDFLSKGGSIFCRGQFITENASIIMENLRKKIIYRDWIKKTLLKEWHITWAKLMHYIRFVKEMAELLANILGNYHKMLILYWTLEKQTTKNY